MKPNDRFVGLPNSFWACVRIVGQEAGYTKRGQFQVSAPSIRELASALTATGLNPGHLVEADGRPTVLGSKLLDYFNFRADALNTLVEPRLMNKTSAKKAFEAERRKLRPTCPLPLNKQKGDKRTYAFLTGLVNMIVDANRAGVPCDFDPRRLITVSRNGIPLRTLSRRVDGAFPSVVDPVAIWEVKEYYHTTTFGSRVADGVYETLLDGMELAELREHEGVHVLHYLIVDDHYTWCECGRSYLCRILDALHMGYVDEVLFGREVLERLPQIVREWVRISQ